MRLNKDEIDAIRTIIIQLDPHAKIRLFGSRVDDKSRGGDIDLIVISKTLTYSDKLLLRSRIKEKLGNRKIDLIITEKPETPFARYAFNNSVLL